MRSPADTITVVSGLPRSGTSMMMQMLEAGGMAVLTDGVRAPNEDNPRGYCEFEAAKKIRRDAGWLAEAPGRGVKVVSMLLYDLPAEFRYQIVFMRRELLEILASQRVMLERAGGGPSADIDDAVMAAKFEQHLVEMEEWMGAQDNMEVMYVRYDEVLDDPLGQAQAVADFLNCGLDAAAMTSVCDRMLYRQRGRAGAWDVRPCRQREQVA